ncbi:MAG: hypothetical protein PHQ40_02830 [Anaerolineaceae bacterium]|nr:hypothetical protein [Anaerolineaceae bacterium]
MAPESFLFGLGSFAFHILVFLGLLRVKLPFGWLPLQVTTGLLSFCAGSAIGYAAFPDFSVWYALSIFGFGWFCFFFVTGIFYVSVSVGIIHYLYYQPGSSSSLDDLYKECIVDPFARRASILAQTGLVKQTDSGYEITKRGLALVARIRNIRKILHLDERVFYSDETGANPPLNND